MRIEQSDRTNKCVCVCVDGDDGGGERSTEDMIWKLKQIVNWMSAWQSFSPICSWVAASQTTTFTAQLTVSLRTLRIIANSSRQYMHTHKFRTNNSTLSFPPFLAFNAVSIACVHVLIVWAFMIFSLLSSDISGQRYVIFPFFFGLFASVFLLLFLSIRHST